MSARRSGLVCGDGQVCIEGICEPDPCEGYSCDEGEACILGACEPDPCRHVECPPLERCELIQGTAQCVADWVGAMSEPPPEPNTEFDFREPPAASEAGEEVAAGDMVEGGDPDVEPGAGASMMVGDAAPEPKEDEGCDQGASTRGLRTAHLVGLMLLGLFLIRRRRHAA